MTGKQKLYIPCPEFLGKKDGAKSSVLGKGETECRSGNLIYT